MEFVKLNVELEKRADEKQYKAEERKEAVDFFKAELELQKATLNSEILTQNRTIAKTEKEMKEAIYQLEPNLERFDELNARKKQEEKRLHQLEDVLATRGLMLEQMV